MIEIKAGHILSMGDHLEGSQFLVVAESLAGGLCLLDINFNNKYRGTYEGNYLIYKGNAYEIDRVYDHSKHDLGILGECLWDAKENTISYEKAI